MPAPDHTQVIAALAAARTAIDSALVALMQEYPSEEPTAPETPAQAATEGQPGPQPCTHENRTTLPTFGTKEHWVCDDCGYEFRR